MLSLLTHRSLFPTIYIDMFCDSKQVFDAVAKRRMNVRNHSMIDILATPEIYRPFKIRDIGRFKKDQNSDDALSMLKGNNMLDRLIETRKDDTQVVQWIDRSSTQASKIAKRRECSQYNAEDSGWSSLRHVKFGDERTMASVSLSEYCGKRA